MVFTRTGGYSIGNRRRSVRLVHVVARVSYGGVWPVVSGLSGAFVPMFCNQLAETAGIHSDTVMLGSMALAGSAVVNQPPVPLSEYRTNSHAGTGLAIP